MMHVAKNLRFLRRQAGLTQAALAKKTGLPGHALGRYEQGYVVPPPDALRRLAAALGVGLQELCSVDLSHSRRYQAVKAAIAENSASLPHPNQPPVQILVELDGTLGCLNWALARLRALHDAITPPELPQA